MSKELVKNRNSAIGNVLANIAFLVGSTTFVETGESQFTDSDNAGTEAGLVASTLFVVATLILLVTSGVNLRSAQRSLTHGQQEEISERSQKVVTFADLGASMMLVIGTLIFLANMIHAVQEHPADSDARSLVAGTSFLVLGATDFTLNALATLFLERKIKQDGRKFIEFSRNITISTAIGALSFLIGASTFLVINTKAYLADNTEQSEIGVVGPALFAAGAGYTLLSKFKNAVTLTQQLNEEAEPLFSSVNNL